MDADELARRVAVLDQEIQRLSERAQTTPDPVIAEHDRRRIDELLEQRHALAPAAASD